MKTQCNWLRTLWVVLLSCIALGAGAQKPTHGGIPDDVYYLMPAFGQGVVYFQGKAPAQGMLNICAMDHTLRFLDEEGGELTATDIDNVLKVQIGAEQFLYHQERFYRLYPVSLGVGVAVLRTVRATRESTGAYGASTQTSAVTHLNSINTDGVTYDISDGRSIECDIAEKIFLYQGNTVLPLTKANVKKLYPERKAAIDAWFKAGHSFPRNPDEAVATLRQLAGLDE